jgi:hypothetical protein
MLLIPEHTCLVFPATISSSTPSQEEKSAGGTPTYTTLYLRDLPLSAPVPCLAKTIEIQEPYSVKGLFAVGGKSLCCNPAQVVI